MSEQLGGGGVKSDRLGGGGFDERRAQVDAAEALAMSEVL
jgi:hypothetical protein